MNLQQRLKADLTAAMKRRDDLRVRTIRALLGLIDNAGAVEVEHDKYEVKTGLSHDVDRREVTTRHMRELIEAERDDLAAAAREYESLGETDMAEELSKRAAIADEYLG
jgi:uncharacterized protein YqeY